jgi:hypothetical protein
MCLILVTYTTPNSTPDLLFQSFSCFNSLACADTPITTRMIKAPTPSACGGLKSLRLIVDAEGPNIIAQAIFSGHLAAREFDEGPDKGHPSKVERIFP